MCGALSHQPARWSKHLLENERWKETTHLQIVNLFAESTNSESCRWWEGSSYNKFGQKAVNLGDLEIVWRVDSFANILLPVLIFYNFNIIQISHYSNFVRHKPETYLIGGLFITQLAIDSVMTFRNWLFMWLCFQFCAVAKTGNRKLICAIGAALIAVWSVNGWFPDSIKAALEKLIFKTNSCFCTVSDKKHSNNIYHSCRF